MCGPHVTVRYGITCKSCSGGPAHLQSKRAQPARAIKNCDRTHLAGGKLPIMDQLTRSNTADRTVGGGLGRHSTPHGPFRRFLRGLIHFFSYHLILARRSTRAVRAAGFRLTVRPTVFHPRFFISSERFAAFIGGLDLSGKLVVDIGTGSGILALAAARAGAKNVIATD